LTGNVLLSVRHTDAVYLIDRLSGTILWKLGGNSIAKDGERHITVSNDPEGTFHGQHDARFEPNSNISLYDNQSWNPSLASRGVEYHIDTVSGTAPLVWSFASPNGKNSPATGSFRRLAGGSDNVIAWGFQIGTLFDEVDSGGNLLLDVHAPGQAPYRVIKVSPRTLDHASMRKTAGLAPFFLLHVPVIYFIGPASGPSAGGASVTITGSGFTGASEVSFGQTAASFSVLSDSAISATVPAGTGVAGVVVTGPLGSSAPVASNQLAPTASDSSFENGIGTWTGSAGASLSQADNYSRTGQYSLQVTLVSPAAVSAQTGRYPLPAGALVNGSLWVLSPAGTGNLEAMISFYSAGGSMIASSYGIAVLPVGGVWTDLSVTAVAPPGTYTVAIGLTDLAASGAFYVDDASLSGFAGYDYV
jgi:hypothetical protein